MSCFVLILLFVFCKFVLYLYVSVRFLFLNLVNRASAVLFLVSFVCSFDCLVCR